MKLFKKNRVWGAAVVCVALVLFLIPREAGAIFHGNIGNMVLWLMQLPALLMSIVGGLLISLAGYLVTWMLELNSQILDSSNTLMYTGWRIARDFANLGFVLLTVIIAFATILRYKEYGYQKLLFNLIKAAILVNFSLAIAGVFIDFSDLATNFFKARIGGGQDIAKLIAGAFAPQRLYMENDVANSEEAKPPDEVGGGTKATVAMISSIAELVFVIAFSLITAITMLGLAFMLLLRFVWLSFLLMVSPLVYLAWVMPGMNKHWKSWWDKFFQWVFFGPAVMFFVYVALLSAEKLGATPAGISEAGFFLTSLNSIMTQGAQMIILSAVMLGGLMAAQKMGIAGADVALKAAKGVGQGVQKWSGNKAMRWGVDPARKLGALTGSGALGVANSIYGRVRGRSSIRLHDAQVKLQTAAAAPRTESRSLIGSTLGGAKDGSGLFGKGRAKKRDWACSECHETVSSVKEPIIACKNGGSTPKTLARGGLHSVTNAWILVSSDK